MGQMPVDATHWDCGDWIEWHRTGTRQPELQCAAIGDQSAKLTLLVISLLRSASSYHQLTGHHLDIYTQISRVHAALRFGVPLTCDNPLEETGVLVMTLRPDASELSVEVDLSLPFSSVLVVRIDPQFEVEARMVTRRSMGGKADGTRVLKWRQLPRGR